MANFCSNVSLYCFLNTAVGGPPTTIFASFFAASTVFFHSSCDSAERAKAAKRSTMTTSELYAIGRRKAARWLISTTPFLAIIDERARCRFDRREKSLFRLKGEIWPQIPHICSGRRSEATSRDVPFDIGRTCFARGFPFRSLNGYPCTHRSTSIS